MSSHKDPEAEFKARIFDCWKELFDNIGTYGTNLPKGWSIKNHTDFGYMSAVCLVFEDKMVVEVNRLEDTRTRNDTPQDIGVFHHHKGDRNKVIGFLDRLIQPAVERAMKKRAEQQNHEEQKKAEALTLDERIMEAIACLPEADDPTP